MMAFKVIAFLSVLSDAGFNHRQYRRSVQGKRRTVSIPSVTPSGYMDREIAEATIASALKKALELKVKMNIAVVDKGANLVGFIKMDGAWLGSVDIALKKAKTAAFFNMDTGIIGTLSQPGGELYNIEHSNNGLITFPGGVPIKNTNGELIGAVGVSGDSVENDHAVAKAAEELQ